MKKIIFICHGNICRSPMAEFIFRELLRREGRSDEFEISSAAVSYEEQGKGVYPPAAAKLREKEIPFGGHRAHRIMPEEAASADLLVIMDASNERRLSRIIRPEDMEKVHYMMEFAGRPGGEVPDPWYTGNFEFTYNELLKACKGLL